MAGEDSMIDKSEVSCGNGTGMGRMGPHGMLKSPNMTMPRAQL